MDIFRKSAGYFGQDIHIWRNGKPFPLHKFFSDTGTITYDYQIPLDTNNKYENITIIGTNTPEIQVNPYVSNPNQPKITNFYIRVKDTIANRTVSVLIQIHDNLDKIWLSPNNISFRSGMNAKYGVLANFTDGIYADLSYYPEITYSVSSNLSGVLQTSGDSVIKAIPSPNYPSSPTNYSNDITVNIPPYFLSTTTPLALPGSIRILSDFGSLKLHSGNIKEIDKRMNILCLSDGFNNTAGANRSTFRKIVTKYQKELIKNTVYAPWNLFKDKINLWSYYLEGLDDVATLDEPHILLNNNDVAFELHYFIQLFDELINAMKDPNGALVGLKLDDLVDKIKDSYGDEFANFLELKNQGFNANLPITQLSTPGIFVNLDYLCAIVGLSTIADANTNISDMRDKWKNDLQWVSGNFMVTPETAQPTDFFLHEYIFKIWKKISKRIYLEKKDTAFGMKNTRRFRDNLIKFTTANAIYPGSLKFPCADYNDEDLKNFGKFIHNIQQVQDFGSIFYDDDGNPQLSNTGNIELDKIIRPADNIIFLSRIKLTTLRGVNISYNYDNYSARRSFVSLDSTNSDKGIICDVSGSSGDTRYSQRSLNFDIRDNEVRNTIAHEFSHNYLRDEYSGKLGNITGKTDASAIVTELQVSNLTTKYDLETSPGSNNIDGSKVKWRWPRVSKIGIGLAPIINLTGNTYQLKIKTNARKAKDKNLFDINDRILLRKRFLFTLDIVVGTIKGITPDPNDKSIQTINIDFSSSITNPTSYNSDYIIIFPFWRTQTEYQELIHHEIRDAITNTGVNGSAMVEKDPVPPKLDAPQEITNPFRQNNLSLINKFTRTTDIVGLYAGGHSSYEEGIYHGAGFCLIRGSENNVPNTFCPVCSYMLIDYLDPLKHPFADANYGEYPL